MEVILKEDVVGLGYKDDVVTVKNGYGRNFLIPTGKAIIATEAAKKILAENLRQRAHKIAAIKKEAEERAQKYQGVRLSITAHTNVATGSLYGSVTGAEIAEELTKLGLETDRKLVYIKAIKEIGNYTAIVRLHKEVAVEIPVEVLSDAPKAEEKKEEAPAPAELPLKKKHLLKPKGLLPIDYNPAPTARPHLDSRRGRASFVRCMK